VKPKASRLHACLDNIAWDGEASTGNTSDEAGNQRKDEVIVGLRGAFSQASHDILEHQNESKCEA
jgi:hypothetical protein